MIPIIRTTGGSCGWTRPKAPVTWRSAEYLRMATEHYRYLVVIHYNDLRPRKGAGSCIFLHVAPPPGGGTAGCTALAAEDLLDPAALDGPGPAIRCWSRCPSRSWTPPARPGACRRNCMPAIPDLRFRTSAPFRRSLPCPFAASVSRCLLLSPVLYAQAAKPTLHEALLAARADRAGEPGVAAAFRRLAETHGTPLYVYDQAHIQGQVKALKAAFAPRFPKLRILYAIKANTNPAVIGLLRSEGLGAEVVSQGEIETALRVGFAGSEIMFTSSSKSPQEIRRSIELGAVLNVDSLDELVRSRPRRAARRSRPASPSASTRAWIRTPSTRSIPASPNRSSGCTSRMASPSRPTRRPRACPRSGSRAPTATSARRSPRPMAMSSPHAR